MRTLQQSYQNIICMRTLQPSYQNDLHENIATKLSNVICLMICYYENKHDLRAGLFRKNIVKTLLIKWKYFGWMLFSPGNPFDGCQLGINLFAQCEKSDTFGKYSRKWRYVQNILRNKKCFINK
jgi:hypothetical protein